MVITHTQNILRVYMSLLCSHKEPFHRLSIIWLVTTIIDEPFDSFINI